MSAVLMSSGKLPQHLTRRPRGRLSGKGFPVEHRPGFPWGPVSAVNIQTDIPRSMLILDPPCWSNISGRIKSGDSLQASRCLSPWDKNIMMLAGDLSWSMVGRGRGVWEDLKPPHPANVSKLY